MRIATQIDNHFCNGQASIMMTDVCALRCSPGSISSGSKLGKVVCILAVLVHLCLKGMSFKDLYLTLWLADKHAVVVVCLSLAFVSCLEKFAEYVVYEKAPPALGAGSLVSGHKCNSDALICWQPAGHRLTGTSSDAATG